MPNQVYSSISPYYLTPLNNNTYLDFWVGRKITPRPTDVLYTIPKVYEFRPDYLAYDLYQDSRFWWVFAARNPNRLGADPYFNFLAGLQIYIPTIGEIKKSLNL